MPTVGAGLAMTRLKHWWRHLHWFDMYRARDWQTVILLGITSVLLGAAYTIARFSGYA